MVAVSIIVPCYNAASFISDALVSVQQQTFTDWECLVVDDGSSDNSGALIQNLARSDRRFVPILRESNSGPSAARNEGIKAALGRWLTLLDADDAYAPDRLARLVALAERTRADMVFDNQALSDFPSTRQVGRAFHWLDKDEVRFTREDFFERSSLFDRSINLGYMKPLFSMSLIDAHCLRYQPQFRSGEDFLFYASAFAHDPTCYATSYCGYIYRRRYGSVSRSGGQHLKSHARMSDAILARHGFKLPESSKRALLRRKAYFIRAAALHETRLALANRDLGAALKTVLAQPGAIVAALAEVRRRMLVRI